jgi:PAS domain S-box-containing protein
MASIGSIAPRSDGLRVLLEASSVLLHAGSEEEVFSQTLDLASTLLRADAYGVWREASDSQIWRAVARRGLSEAYPTVCEWNGRSLPDEVWAVEDVATDDRLVFGGAVYEGEGIQSVLMVPWASSTATRGAIVYYWRVRRQFSHDDVDYARALSNLSLSALNRLELHEQNRREKQRLAFLAEASAVLASSLDYESTLEQVARLAVTQIAGWCTVHVSDPGATPGATPTATTRVAVAHADPAMESLAEEYSRRYPEQIEADRGLGKVLRTGEPEVVPRITDEMLMQAAVDEEHLRALRRFKFSSSIVVPLVARGKVLGAIRLLGTEGRYFGASDVQLALDLGRRAAVAIENAQLHRAVLEQEMELRLSHAAAKMGSWTWDLERDRLFWSDEFRALHGLPAEAEASGEASYELVHPEDRERSKQDFWKVLESTETLLRSEHRSITPDGRVLWLQVRGRIRRDAEGKATWIAGLIIDVTESRLAEQALRRTEKLAAAGRLAATVAHEVNNPLEALVNVIYLAERVEGLPDEAAAHLRIADGELRRMAHIVRQTLGFYRESTLPQRTELVALVREVLDLYRSRGESRGLTLRLSDDSDGEALVMLIAGELRQVVANLIANAIDATRPGGVVEASVRTDERWAEIAVMDTGCGISEANRRHLFEPFFTTKADVGTGLGLWVSKGIVEKYGGSIAMDANDEADAAGTTVRVRLPLDAIK